MRILIASDHFPPFIGGAHRWASLLATGLAGRGHEVSVATVWHPGLPRHEDHGSHRVPVHRLRQLRTVLPVLARTPGQRHSPPFPDPVTVHELRRVIARRAPEVVLAHGWVAFSVAVAMGRRRIPLIVSSHDYGYFCTTRVLVYRDRVCSGPGPFKCMECAGHFYGLAKGWQARLGTGLSKPLLRRRMTALHSVSTYVEETMLAHFVGGSGLESSRRFVIPAFISDPAPATRADQRLLSGLPEEPFILFVGALRPIKGVGVLLEAYQRLRHPAPPLVLIGTVERDTPRLPSQVTVIKDAPHSAVMAAWDRAMLAVAPSVWPEPLGTVAIEAVSRGIPAIATGPSGFDDVLGEGAGVLVAQDDAIQLAEAMQSLLDDPARRQELTARGRTKAARFAADAVLVRYEQMLRDVSASHPPALPPQ